jgi:hypothetical protein
VISLSEFVSRHRGIRLATPADNESILAFFDRAPMETSSFAVQYRRAPDFFRLLRYQADRSHVFIGEDDAGVVHGVASLSLRPGWIDGGATTVGYLGDLRVGADRKVIAAWRSCYGALLASAHEIAELADCRAWFTVILDANTLARRALGRAKAGGPQYVALARFTMRNLVARLPGARRAQSRWRVCNASDADVPALTRFLNEENRALPLGFRDALARHLHEWDGLAASHFVVAREGDAIVACLAPWSPSAAKETLVSRVPRALTWMGGVAAAVAPGWARIPSAGEPLRVGYLTHLTFRGALGDDARAEVFRAMVDHLFDAWPDAPWHCAAVADFDAWRLERQLSGFVQQQVPITVYGVLPPNAATTAVDALRAAGPPAFEMAIV